MTDNKAEEFTEEAIRRFGTEDQRRAFHEECQRKQGIMDDHGLRIGALEMGQKLLEASQSEMKGQLRAMEVSAVEARAEMKGMIGGVGVTVKAISDEQIRTAAYRSGMETASARSDRDGERRSEWAARFVIALSVAAVIGLAGVFFATTLNSEAKTEEIAQ